MTEPPVVVDASALVDAVAATALREAVIERLGGAVLHAPAHLDGEVLSALDRLHRAGDLTADDVRLALHHLRQLPLQRHHLPPLLLDAWDLCGSLPTSDALYVALAERLGAALVTTDQRLARAYPPAEGLR